MTVINAIAALDSNYIWAIHSPRPEPLVYLVDPGDAKAALDYLQQHKAQLGAILVTHRHGDHINGIDELLTHWQVPVHGPPSPAVPQVSHTLYDNDVFSLGCLTVKVLAVPGHTSEHIAYWLPEQEALFCGDALFAGGCGRMYDGPAEVMWASLLKLAALPDSTALYCAHEYTLDNLAFARTVEPDNAAIAQRYQQVYAQRNAGLVTLPSLLALEKRTNPFLRCQEKAVQLYLGAADDLPNAQNHEVFALLRSAKDCWNNNPSPNNVDK